LVWISRRNHNSSRKKADINTWKTALQVGISQVPRLTPAPFRYRGEIALGRFVGPDAERVTVRELATDYLNDYRTDGRKSLDKAERMVKRYDDDSKEIDSELITFFGDLKAHNVGTDRIRAYTAKRIEEKAASATINRELAALKRMFSLGIQAEKIHRKPYVPMLKENNVRRAFSSTANLSPSEMLFPIILSLLLPSRTTRADGSRRFSRSSGIRSTLAREQ
jgi:hypothetical protein